ncbi:hypothetical protein DV711_11710 [Motiliproteus coralliicola]|uniref:Uncharacterized protein n=1 Tax=Motiliproteus coralliicola TaxID=2283196 RepID=A0A369WEG4_9GAMM|nr:hypothetical protein [Motiliproteus coralliicola]RDE19549.1 hypothetical protein DV711_11710 [Motiliproteus coralliicola]
MEKDVMEKAPKYLAITIIGLSLIFAAQQFYMGLHEIESTDSIYTLWMCLFTVLIAMWCDRDKTGKGWPYEYGFFMFIFWPLVLPYYLAKTRGLDGLVMFFGFGALYALPGLTWYMGYQYS